MLALQVIPCSDHSMAFIYLLCLLVPHLPWVVQKHSTTPKPFFFKIILLIYLFLAVLVLCCLDLGLLSFAVCGLLIVVASPVAEHKL